ncbi:tRNA (adenosine(37)-N6)-threonylcarbamoyltransferase complex ATPase subunit type 1 TsaE, partial [Patescibacteria group bacterium]|nr:tRNA (adenosine(37)-N6)-threonylcarbamoyltransferase complex ATPase subunit type 1 TsaE [Patescibacteria group bacterium]
MTRTLATVEELAEEAQVLARSLAPKSDGATLVTLSGDLGAGKTTFAQSLAKALGVTEHVTSPTFVLAKTYTLKDQTFSELVHIDAYRLKEGELQSIRFNELHVRPDVLIVLEWPERVRESL